MLYAYFHGKRKELLVRKNHHWKTAGSYCMELVGQMRSWNCALWIVLQTRLNGMPLEQCSWRRQWQIGYIQIALPLRPVSARYGKMYRETKRVAQNWEAISAGVALEEIVGRREKTRCLDNELEEELRVLRKKSGLVDYLYSGAFVLDYLW
jgi:hypothetical protein